MSVALADGAELRLSGQIDLILAQGLGTTTRLPEGPGLDHRLTRQVIHSR
jgi:hypothetical protein